MTLYAHQQKGIAWLASKPSAMLADDMGIGKTRQSLLAARKLFDALKVDRVLVLAPASVCGEWKREMAKLAAESASFDYNLLRYDAKQRQMFVELVGGSLNGNPRQHMPVAVVSYALLPQARHAEAVGRYVEAGKAVLICDESSFLKNRNAKQTKAALKLAAAARCRWLLSGTPVCNSQLDLYAQGKVMAPHGGPLAGIDSFYHFEWKFGSMVAVEGRNGKPLHVVGRVRNGRVGVQVVKRWVPDEEKLKELTKRFAPYVLRREKRDCLDLPAKTYTVREVALDDETWRIYQELKKEAMLSLGGGSEARPEPNAGVRLLRLCQLTSGHVTMPQSVELSTLEAAEIDTHVAIRDVSSEKLDYLADAILSGELANERAVIVWCRWVRERERLVEMLLKTAFDKIVICQIFGGQTAGKRAENIEMFQQAGPFRRVLLAQQHAGGFGLNLTAASTAVFLSHDFSYTTRVQAEDRCHRIGQTNKVLYVDILAVGPKGQQTVDHKIIEAIKRKEDVATWTCAAWRQTLEG